MPRVAGSVAAGRVLVAGAGAGAWVDALSEKGLDVYGIDPSRDRFGDDGLVRAADVESHLEQVDGKALALAVLLHPSGSDLATLAPSLYRTARAVAILSEAQWRWQQRIGPPSCDTRPDRPLMAETWIAGLAGAGFEATATYGPGGHDYLIEAS
jgi:hypothetical protein